MQGILKILIVLQFLSQFSRSKLFFFRTWNGFRIIQELSFTMKFPMASTVCIWISVLFVTKVLNNLKKNVKKTSHLSKFLKLKNLARKSWDRSESILPGDYHYFSMVLNRISYKLNSYYLGIACMKQTRPPRTTN